MNMKNIYNKLLIVLDVGGMTVDVCTGILTIDKLITLFSYSEPYGIN